MTREDETLEPEPHLRSALFVPAHRSDLIAKAYRSGADAVVLDLEDAVPEEERAAARQNVRDAVAAVPPEPLTCVRTSPAWAAAFRDDLAAAIGEGLLAVLLPKTRGPADVAEAAALLDAAGAIAAGTRIWPLLESARAILAAGAIAAASPRVAYLGGGTSRGGDLAASLGYTWTPDGLETLYLRSRVLLESRAHGIRYPMTGVVTAVHDPAAVETFARQSRQLGYDGMLVIHPSHVPVANAAFGASEEEREEARRTLTALDAVRDGATVSGGHLVDAAMRAAAERALRRRPTPH